MSEPSETPKFISEAAWERIEDAKLFVSRERAEAEHSRLEVVTITDEEWANAEPSLREAQARVAELERLSESLKLQAQCHAQDARTANATIAEIYRVCTGGKGEPGNWHGAEPVRATIADLTAKLEQAERDAERYRFIRDADRSDCITYELGLYAMESLDEYVDAAMDGEAAIDAAQGDKDA